MNNNIDKKLNLLGGIKKNPFCTNEKEQVEPSFFDIEATFSSKLPQSYKDVYKRLGAFSFLKLISVKCIGANSIASKQNKFSVGGFYRVTGNDNCSIATVLLTFEEQLPSGLLPICDGELGDIICMSLRPTDYEFIYYFNHESLPENSLILIARSFEEFIMKLEIHQTEDGDDDLVKKMKMELSPQFLELLKKSGYGPKE